MRRGVLGIVVAALGALAAPAHAVPTFALDAGGTAFWSGRGGGEYALDVRESGSRLRVGIDHATDGDVWTVVLSGPGGVERTFTPGDGLYSAETLVPRPARGRWTIRVTGEDVQDDRFRMRAKLENGERPKPERAEPVLPNLQALPPYEFTFDFPLTNGSTGGAPIGLSLPGGRLSCHAEEVAEEGAQRCLRMAFGVRNTGQGPMQLHYPAGTALEDRTLMQRIVWSDGRTTDRVAGLARYHKTHQHYHHDKAIGLTLWKVTPSGLLLAAPEHLKGFAHRDELLREWRVFYPTHLDFGFGLAAGWGDYYEWDRPGNYIDFGINGDGRYLLRLVADPVAGVLESNEHDNVAYSLIDVAGTEIKLLESGRGTDPSDRCKIVMPFGAEPDLPSGTATAPRPRDCPPDTVDADAPGRAAGPTTAGSPPRPAAPGAPAATAPAARTPPRRPAAKRRCARRGKAAKRCRAKTRSCTKAAKRRARRSASKRAKPKACKRARSRGAKPRAKAKPAPRR